MSYKRTKAPTWIFWSAAAARTWRETLTKSRYVLEPLSSAAHDGCLELQLERQLHDAPWLSPFDLTKTRRIDVIVRQLEVNVVKDIEDLRAIAASGTDPPDAWRRDPHRTPALRTVSVRLTVSNARATSAGGKASHWSCRRRADPGARDHRLHSRHYHHSSGAESAEPPQYSRHHQCHQYRHGAVQLRRPADLRYRRCRTVGWLLLTGRPG